MDSPLGGMNSPMGPNGHNGPMTSGPMGSPMGGPMGGHSPMMVPCSKSSPMGMGGGGGGGPDPTQPLPPSGMGGGPPGGGPNGFNKNSPIMGGQGPPTTDPNYAQQFHNFQQQLYATNTRSQGGGGGMGGPGLPHHNRGATPPQLNNQNNWLPSGPISK